MDSSKTKQLLRCSNRSRLTPVTLTTMQAITSRWAYHKAKAPRLTRASVPHNTHMHDSRESCMQALSRYMHTADEGINNKHFQCGSDGYAGKAGVAKQQKHVNLRL